MEERDPRDLLYPSFCQQCFGGSVDFNVFFLTRCVNFYSCVLQLIGDNATEKTNDWVKVINSFQRR